MSQDHPTELDMPELTRQDAEVSSDNERPHKLTRTESRRLKKPSEEKKKSTRPLSRWQLHIRQFHLDNPDVPHDMLFAEAKRTYKKLPKKQPTGPSERRKWIDFFKKFREEEPDIPFAESFRRAKEQYKILQVKKPRD